MTLRNLLRNRYFVAALVLLVLAGGGIAWLQNRGAAQVKYRLAAVKTGDVTQTVSANGTLNPVVLVNVGTQVSGTVKKLHVDFNDHVKAGQVLLELDPALLEVAGDARTRRTQQRARASLELAAPTKRAAGTLYRAGVHLEAGLRHSGAGTQMRPRRRWTRRPR